MFGKPKRHNETRSVRKLRARLDESHQLHQLTGDPQLNAVRVDRFRASVTRCMWLFLAAGLGFTTTGVHDFLAGHLGPADPMWWGAWLVEPALAGILITLLRWEAEMISRGISADHQTVKRLKRVLLGATLVTNVWSSIRPPSGPINHGMVFLHLVIPLVVYLIAEVMPVIQQRCTTARDKALNAPPPPPPVRLAATTPTVPEDPSPGQSVPNSAVTSPAPVVVPTVRLRLPAPMLAALRDKSAQVRELGRELTAQDVQDAVKVAPEYAARIVRELAATA
jgi:hypothetical protein